MSIFSIIQNSQQQLFSLQMKGRLPETAKTPASGSMVEQDKQEKADERVVGQAEKLVEATSAQTGTAQTESDEIVEDFKDAVDLNSALSRAVKDGADTEREMRIERMAQKIKAMKEKIRFATPEKAKRMLQELQQISKDFKTASLELRKAAEKVGPDTPNRVVDVAADATAYALDKTGGSSEVTLIDLLGYAEDLSSSLQSFMPRSAANVSDPEQLPSPTQEPSNTSPLSGNTDDMGSGQLSSLFGTLESSGFMDRLESELAQKNDAAFRTASVYAYAEQQHQSDSIYRQSRIESMRAEHEALTQLFEEIKLLAGQLETLVDKEDKDVQEAMESLITNLVQGYEILDADDLQEFLGAGRYAPSVGSIPDRSGNAGMTVSMSHISVETSVSISISGIVA